jgi:hypothetical protein
MGTVSPLHKIRVLLAGLDAPFMDVTAFLLGRSGFVVDRTRERRDLVRLVERRKANVVIIDGSDSLAAAARTVAALAAVHPRVGTLIVSEETCELSPGSIRVLPKWGPFGGLAAEIEGAYILAQRPRALADARDALGKERPGRHAITLHRPPEAVS